MKKLILLLATILISQWVVSQSQFRFGLKIAPSFNWMKPDDVKKFENGGTTLGFNWGLTVEYALSENFSFYSGLELNHEKGKINFLETNKAYYYMNDRYDFIETKEENGVRVPEDTTGYLLQLKSRSYKSTYVTIPVGIKMKTKEIGYMTYFGEFGLNLAFRTGTKVTDEVDYLNNNDAKANLNDITDVNMDKDMQPIRVRLRVGLGTEYAASDGTSLFGAIHYNLGFTNVVKGDSRYLINDQSKQFSQKISAHGIQVTVGVLF